MAAAAYLSQVAGELTEVAGVQVGGASNANKIPALNATTGLLDVTMMPVGIGPEVVTVVTSENLASGAFVNLYDNSGTKTARNADASGGLAKRAHGFVLAATTSPASATVYLLGLNTAASAPSGLSITGEAWLSTVGASIGTPATTSGNIKQKVGVYLPSIGIQFSYHPPIVLV